MFNLLRHRTCNAKKNSDLCAADRWRQLKTPEVRVLSGPFERPSQASFSRLAYDVHFGVMKDDTVLADIIRRTTFGEEEYDRYWGELSDGLLAQDVCWDQTKKRSKKSMSTILFGMV